MARPKGSTHVKTIYRDALKTSFVSVAEAARNGDKQAQRLFLELTTRPEVKRLVETA